MRRRPSARSRDPVLLVLGADPERWAERYGLQPFCHPCAGCGRELATTLAFATRQQRGLVAPHCSCGHERPPYCVVHLDPHALPSPVIV